MAVSLDEYKKALTSLREALGFVDTASEPAIKKIARDASIQRFEFCVELAWKTSAKIMGTATTAPRQVIREMAQNGLITNVDRWFEFLEARNKSSHTYDDKVAEEVFTSARQFVVEGEALAVVLSKR
jgi:nucleotidyltransferase substrate binding protein (TIGR01987 family)